MISRLVRNRTIVQTLNRASTIRCLSTFDKHRSVFESLGLDKTNNKGVFDGEWKGSGEIVPSYNPVNNEIMAEVITVKYLFFFFFSPTIYFPHPLF